MFEHPGRREARSTDPRLLKWLTSKITDAQWIPAIADRRKCNEPTQRTKCGHEISAKYRCFKIVQCVSWPHDGIDKGAKVPMLAHSAGKKINHINL